ncbi:MAG: phosphoribosylformylglycinamidine synthase subunit PurQ [Armatimonadota bacterium]|jgi:phosphoribosylformylglycinamidine synthase I
MKFGVVQFPGSNGDVEAFYAVRDILKQPVDYIWHQTTEIKGIDCLILPGGAAYGDYVRPGMVAHFSPIIDAVKKFAEDGGRVVGFGNGFQILCEAGLLPGALLLNDTARFMCKYINVRVENNASDYTCNCSVGQVLSVPIAHAHGRYWCEPGALRAMEDANRVLLRYCDKSGNVTEDANPNGSAKNIAGILNDSGNVAGMMPHPERAVEKILGSTDGIHILQSIVDRLG